MNRLEKLKKEKWLLFSEGLKHFENASFESVYSNGWSAASAEHEKIIAELEGALKLYADRKNWRYCANQDIGAHDAWLDFKPDHFCEVYNELGGYNARQALQKLEEFRGTK